MHKSSRYLGSIAQSLSASGAALKRLSVALCVAAAAILPISAHAACSVNVASNEQTIDGFGFSSAWCGTLSTAKNNALYGTLGMSLLRVRIDEDSSNWSYETANAAAAHAAGATVLGCAWGPPSSMKATATDGSYYLPSSQYYNYAMWLNAAATAHDLDYCSVQNELDLSMSSGATWTGEELKNFCAGYAQYIGVPVAMADAVGFTDSVTDPTLNDTTAASHVSIAAGHLYGNGNYVHTNAISKGKRVWMTEHYIENSISSWDACMTMAQEISDTMNNQFNAYIWWWVNDGDTSMNLVNSSGTIFKNGYVLGQFAKWIRPGAQRVAADYTPTSGVSVTAYKVDGNLVIVVVNTNSSSVSQSFNIWNGSVGSLLPYRTSSSESMAKLSRITVASGGSFTATLAAKSVTTFVESIPDGTYKLINACSSKALGCAGGGTTNGTTLDQWSYFGASTQKWTFAYQGSGIYKITSAASGKSLDVYNWSTANGGSIDLWDWWGGTIQQWYLKKVGSNYVITSVYNDKALDVSNFSTANGGVVYQWTETDATNQQWTIGTP
jgi:glucuronoarabinoxylan endo-1,4-beta-xylanase